MKLENGRDLKQIDQFVDVKNGYQDKSPISNIVTYMYTYGKPTIISRDAYNQTSRELIAKWLPATRFVQYANASDYKDKSRRAFVPELNHWFRQLNISKSEARVIGVVRPWNWIFSSQHLYIDDGGAYRLGKPYAGKGPPPHVSEEHSFIVIFI